MRGKQFSSTYQPKNKGRKPSKLKKYIKDNNIGAPDVSCVIKNVLFSYTQDQLKEVLTDTKKPMIVRLFIKAFLTDFKYGNLTNVDKLLNRAFGAPDQNVNMAGDVGLNITNIPPSERKERIDKLIQERINDKRGEVKDEENIS
jgi:hypothetical protein